MMNLNIENIRHNYGKNIFSYTARLTNSITGIYGHSGSGKTTLMKIICGIETPSTGKLIFNKTTFFDKRKRISIPANKRKIGIVFQDNYLFPHLTVKKNLLYSKSYLKKKDSLVSLNTVVDLLNIKSLLNKKPFQLSGGEKQRVAIGRALLSHPQLLLLDEPFSNLDKKKREQIISYLLKINNQFKIPMLIISHDLDDILKLTHSLLVIEDGNICSYGDYSDIIGAGAVPHIISPKNFLNIFELYHIGYQKKENLHIFGSSLHTKEPIIKTSSDKLADTVNDSKRIRLSINPDDIAITTKHVNNTSIQNQLKGTVISVLNKKNSCFLTIDCGIKLIAEVTNSAVNKMKLKRGKKIICLIKAKAINIVHIYNN